jgi:hypothetical protein
MITKKLVKIRGQKEFLETVQMVFLEVPLIVLICTGTGYS